MRGFAIVRTRAREHCEYCGLSQAQEPLAFHIEHILARQHGGKDVLENLALACQHCNLHKGPNLSGVDPETGEVTRLFNPRHDHWTEHFVQRDGEVIGLTSTGRATVKLLKMNAYGRRELRRS